MQTGFAVEVLAREPEIKDQVGAVVIRVFIDAGGIAEGVGIVQAPDDVAGFDEAVVKDVIKKIDRSEYKRRQAAPGAKITKRAFGRERRYPITNGYK
jgi:hypothetical protein